MSQRPSIQFPAPRDMGIRAWGTETLIAQGDGYIGKRLEMRAGTAGGLQYHVHKEESFLLVEGEAWVDTGDDEGRLASFLIQPGQMVHVPKGAVHRVRAVTDCTFYEWSSPHFDDRVRVEREYGEPDGGGLPTTS